VLPLLAACAGTRPDYPRETSHALSDPGRTQLGRSFAQAAAEQGGKSAFHLLAAGVDGFIARAVSAGAAERTLDVQYYIVHDGLTTRVLVDQMLKAADRGVRVRLLIDDTASHGNDYNVARISAHPNVEVRVFNALYAGRGGAIRRGLGMLGDLGRLHRRMHNKLWVADGVVGIVGGRNLGDEYFAAKQGVNFADLDVLAFGPVVSELSRSFDAYWNSQWAVPIEAFVSSPPSPAELARSRGALQRYLESPEVRESDYVRRLRSSQFLDDLRNRRLPVVWAPAHAVWDDPDKVGTDGRPDDALLLSKQLRELVGGVQSEVLFISPYFVPGREGVAALANQVRSGVKVTVITNSLEATDVAAVHSGYAPYRADLLRAGVQLYEVRASAGAARANTERSLAIGSSSASLHTKAMVFDRRSLYIGSMNLDPRSAWWNTELGVHIDSPELAEQGWALAAVGMQPAQSYKLELDGADAGASGGRMVWVTEEGGRRKTYTSEPAGVWRRFSAWFSGLVAPEEML
jgi:putative cardiolipin synthase